MKKIVIGILAHVDAGKTTLSENMLYLSKSIRTLGRVDHGNSYLDYDHQEKDRGITIFSSQAQFSWNNTVFTLIDTPGHIDFSSEMERTLSVLDYAIIVLSGSEGIQSHSETIWNLLEYYQIPAFIFVNKMDMINANKEEIMKSLISDFSDHCIDFSCFNDSFYENISLTSDSLLDEYLNEGIIKDGKIVKEIEKRNIFPCFFGSALKNQGIEEFLNSLDKFTIEKKYPDQLSIRVFKISKDKNDLLTHVKITGGKLKVKTVLENGEKVDGIRIYSGSKYESVKEVEAGDICTLIGVHNLNSGDALGNDNIQSPILSSYMNYRLILPAGSNKHTMMENLKQLAKEDPQLHIRYDHDDIMISLMGEIQIDILKTIIKERFGEDVEFDQGHVIYKETILKPVEGVGHYEPLSHYAEVHLLMEPLKEGSGIVVDSICKDDELEKHWQRLIITHILEKEHLGVLIGAPITDMKITLVSAKAHLKHTEGGDFRQATYRAIRQGLKMTQCAVLEPFYKFRLEIPNEYLSRAIYNIEAMNGTFRINSDNDIAIIEGEASVKAMQNYQREVISYTKGKGKLYLNYANYKRCQDEEDIIKEINYNSETDLDNPTGSIFCSHGAGFNVTYDKVYDYMHLPLSYKTEVKKVSDKYKTQNIEDELDEIFIRTYGPIKNRSIVAQQSKKEVIAITKEKKPECLLVDGYNVIFTSDELNVIAKDNLDVARNRLIDMLSNYQGYKQCILILVFDAYKVKGNYGTIEKNNNIYIVYTKEAQTADMYIERTTHEMASMYDITVATSDALEQLIVTAKGANRISSRQLLLEMENLNHEKYQKYKTDGVSRNYLLEDIKNIK